MWLISLRGAPSPPIFGITLAEDNVAGLWNVRPSADVASAHFSTFLLLCCWRLWKHRYDVAF
jgi:hypothetical protein